MTLKNGSVNILLVDDKPENLYSLNAILEESNCGIFQARSAREALDLTELHQFALIFADVQMPEMDGFQMLEKLRANPRTEMVPVIFVTATSREEKYVQKGYSEGAVDYLLKPLDPEIVRAKTDVFVSLYRQQILVETQKKNLLRLNDRLVEINKELEQFAYTAAHDLKSPLGAIITLCSALEIGYKERLDDRGNKMIDNIQRSANKLSELISGILAYHKGQRVAEAGSIEVDFSKLCQEIAEMFKGDTHVKIYYPTEPIIISINVVAMKQILINLISNGIKHNDKSNPELYIQYREEKDWYIFSVRDNGPGVDKKDQQRIFELFTTLFHSQETEPAAGIGLATIKKLVEHQGGKIMVDSAPGLGFTLQFAIPRKT
jgi:signal transduction histidine kinase